MSDSSHRGFTLLELLVCIAIIGVVCGLTLSAVMQASAQAPGDYPARTICGRSVPHYNPSRRRMVSFPGVYCGIIGPTRLVNGRFRRPASLRTGWIAKRLQAKYDFRSQFSRSTPIGRPSTSRRRLSYAAR